MQTQVPNVTKKSQIVSNHCESAGVDPSGPTVEISCITDPTGRVDIPQICQENRQLVKLLG